MKRIGDLADFPNLLEHIMIDVKGTIGQTPSCLGSPTFWKKPQGRFDLFVEATDPRIGIFSACFAANLMNNFIVGNPVEDDFHLLLEVTDMITMFPETKEEIAKIAIALSDSVDNISSAINQLAHFHYLDNGNQDGSK